MNSDEIEGRLKAVEGFIKLTYVMLLISIIVAISGLGFRLEKDRTRLDTIEQAIGIEQVEVGR